MDMKVYHCENPAENPVPRWLRHGGEEPPGERTLVEQFKANPDAFFPELTRQKHAAKTGRRHP